MRILLLLSFFLSALGSAAQRPNFLVIIADDLTWLDLGFAGNKEVRTPNLDRLRSEGMWMDHVFDPASTCSPTRHAIYTGLHCIRSGAYPNHTKVYDGTQSIFTYLKDDGYRVALQNKSHVGPPASFPYEHIDGADDLTPTSKFLSRDKQQPWLLVFASNDPHSPWTRGPKYDPSKITIPPYLHDNATTRKALAAYYGEISMLDSQVGKLLKLLDKTGQSENTLVLFVSEQGNSFPYGGKWSLYDNGIRASTLVRWPGKIKPGSISHALVQYTDITPTLLSIAGVDPKTIDTGCPDANGNKGFDGADFTDVLLGKAQTFHDFVYSQHTTVGIIGFKEPYPMRAVRDARYKYIRNLTPGNTYFINGIHLGKIIDSWRADAKTDAELAKRIAWLSHRPGEELYDLDTDPTETRNLAAEATHAETKARLSNALDMWMAQQGDLGLETELKANSRLEGKGSKGKSKASK